MEMKMAVDPHLSSVMTADEISDPRTHTDQQFDVASLASNKKPFEMTDDEIKKEISVPRTHTDQKFDVASLFAIVTNILNPATIAADNVFRVYVYVTTLHTLFYKNFPLLLLIFV